MGKKLNQSEAVSDYYCFYLDCHLNRLLLIQDQPIGRANGLTHKVSSASRATEYFEVQEELPWDNSKAIAMNPAGVEMEEKPKTTSSSRRSSGSTTAAVSSIALDSTKGYFFNLRRGSKNVTFLLFLQISSTLGSAIRMFCLDMTIIKLLVFCLILIVAHHDHGKISKQREIIRNSNLFY